MDGCHIGSNPIAYIHICQLLMLAERDAFNTSSLFWISVRFLRREKKLKLFKLWLVDLHILRCAFDLHLQMHVMSGRQIYKIARIHVLSSRPLHALRFLLAQCCKRNFILLSWCTPGLVCSKPWISSNMQVSENSRSSHIFLEYVSCFEVVWMQFERQIILAIMGAARMSFSQTKIEQSFIGLCHLFALSNWLFKFSILLWQSRNVLNNL